MRQYGANSMSLLVHWSCLSAAWLLADDDASLGPGKNGRNVFGGSRRVACGKPQAGACRVWI